VVAGLELVHGRGAVIEAQTRLADLLVRAVALEALGRQDRPHLAAEIYDRGG
jgi:hypothetical protein